MSWFERLAGAASEVYDTTVTASTEYLNTRVNDYTKDPQPVQTVGRTTAAPDMTKEPGLLGHRSQTLASIAADIGVILAYLRSR